ncbi:unnamed protein product [Lepeophtheirus salmonis]|uniref:(salmon louse) hypothetical protein n=1 Tax=Lepeophtheirus salmonis TaxID=72036 RepID=A0A7R8CPT8_LEPSM|nr:unnamed protein product [Lepeophtheirus salmonis]CAF2889351.1 unnamed protein product [Lepeophtheirus salmonis]
MPNCSNHTAGNTKKSIRLISIAGDTVKIDLKDFATPPPRITTKHLLTSGWSAGTRTASSNYQLSHLGQNREENPFPFCTDSLFKNGEISKEELLGLFAKLGNELSPSTLESYFRIASKDNSVGINFEEFKTLWDCLTSPEEISSEIRDEFSRLDEDSDGFITTEEMMSVVNKFSHVLGDRKEIAEKCLKDIDINGDVSGDIISDLVQDPFVGSIKVVVKGVFYAVSEIAKVILGSTLSVINIFFKANHSAGVLGDLYFNFRQKHSEELLDLAYEGDLPVVCCCLGRHCWNLRSLRKAKKFKKKTQEELVEYETDLDNMWRSKLRKMKEDEERKMQFMVLMAGAKSKKL